MSLYKFEFPIEDYTGSEVFYQPLYVKSDNFPTENQIIELLERLSESEKQNTQFSDDTWLQCRNVFDMYEPSYVGSSIPSNRLARMPHLYSDWLMTNTRVCHPKFGDVSWSVTKLDSRIFEI